MRASLVNEVAAFLRKHGPARSTVIANGVRARRELVAGVLAGEGFSRVARPEGAHPKAVYWNVSPLVPRAQGGKSRATLMLEVLADGGGYSRDEIFALSGRVFLTNNAASELRRRGHDVRHEGGVYWLASLTQPEAATRSRPRAVSGSASKSTERTTRRAA